MEKSTGHPFGSRTGSTGQNHGAGPTVAGHLGQTQSEPRNWGWGGRISGESGQQRYPRISSHLKAQVVASGTSTKNGVERCEVLVEVCGGFLLQRFRVGRLKAPGTSKIHKNKKCTVKTQGCLAGLGSRWREVCLTD